MQFILVQSKLAEVGGKAFAELNLLLADFAFTQTI
jgi:hypothetical protein